MMDIAVVIGLFSLVIAAFGLGYRIGRDKRNDAHEKE